jgi:micrococcal nuclease
MRYILLFFCFLFISVQAETVHSIHDGDTFRLVRPQIECLQSGRKQKKHQRVRFCGIDAPELSQPNGTQSRDYLQSLIEGKNVQLECTGCSFDRKVCKVRQNGQDVEREMVRSGWAFDNAKFSHGQYAKQEREAKNKHAGVWMLPGGGVRPWDYRKKR